MTKRELLKQIRAAERAKIAEIEAREPFFVVPARKATPGRRSNSEIYQGLLPYRKPTTVA